MVCANQFSIYVLIAKKPIDEQVEQTAEGNIIHVTYSKVTGTNGLKERVM